MSHIWQMWRPAASLSSTTPVEFAEASDWPDPASVEDGIFAP